MASTIITTNADALKRAARKISTQSENLNPNHVLNALSGAIAGPGKSWGFIQGAPDGRYVQPGLAAAAAPAPAWVLFVEGKGAYSCTSRGQALDIFSKLAEHAENKEQAEADLLQKGAATVQHPDYSPIRIHLSEPQILQPKCLHETPPLRPGVPLTDEVIERLTSLVSQRKSIVISGPPGVGKTTILGIISHGLPRNDKVVCIQACSELPLFSKNTITCKVKQRNEKSGRKSCEEVLSAVAWMKPDWIVVGELTTAAAFTSIVDLGTTGHSFLGTTQAASPSGAILRMEESLKIKNPKVSRAKIRAQIAETGLISVCLHPQMEGKPPRIEAITVSIDAAGDFVFSQVQF